MTWGHLCWSCSWYVTWPSRMIGGNGRRVLDFLFDDFPPHSMCSCVATSASLPSLPASGSVPPISMGSCMSVPAATSSPGASSSAGVPSSSMATCMANPELPTPVAWAPSSPKSPLCASVVAPSASGVEWKMTIFQVLSSLLIGSVFDHSLALSFNCQV